jgi:hypothetical protein
LALVAAATLSSLEHFSIWQNQGLYFAAAGQLGLHADRCALPGRFIAIAEVHVHCPKLINAKTLVA